MIKDSAIQWTGVTYNPWQGCVKKTIEIEGAIQLREECRHCYMYRDKKRYGQRPEIVVRSAPATFNKPLKVQREVYQGLRPNFSDRLVFTCSWSDWNNPEADEWRPEAWDVIRRCPDLIFQILTKLPERMPDHLPPFWDEIKERCWVGVTAGYQAAADAMREPLRAIDAPHRFVSYEPALGLVDWTGWEGIIDWLICGGESGGTEARPMHPEWARRARDWARANGIAYHLKQWGEWIPTIEIADLTGQGWERGWKVRLEWQAAIKDKEWGCFDLDGMYLEGQTTWNGRQNAERDNYEVTVYRVGKHAAGRTLDGQTWDEFPAVNNPALAG